MKTPYVWRCFVCGEANQPAALTCATCGFPARASGRQIEAARAARNQDKAVLVQRVKIEEKSTIGLVSDALSPLPIWRRVVAIVGSAVMLAGLLWFKVVFSFTEAAWCVVTVICGLAMLGYAYAGVAPDVRNQATKSKRSVAPEDTSHVLGRDG